MAATYEPISTITLSSNNTFTFSSIPSTYTDLKLVVSCLVNVGSFTGQIRFNNISSTTYSDTILYGTGASASSSFVTGDTSLTPGGWGSNGGTQNVLITYDIFSYASSNYKTVLMTWNNDKNATGSVEYSVGLWRSTSAITSIAFLNTISSGSMATLYGIKAA